MSDCNPSSTVTTVDTLLKIQRAAYGDYDTLHHNLRQLLTYRQVIARELLNTNSATPEHKQLSDVYYYVNENVRSLLSL